MSATFLPNGTNGVHNQADEAIDSLYAWMPPAAPAPAPVPEAPASVNVRLTIQGREVQWTLRDQDEDRLAVRLEALLQRYPLAPAQGLSQAQHNAAAMHRPVSGFCAVHNVGMQENHKDGRTWWSHRTADGHWCKGR
jgi:hypothetical protein